MNENSSHLRCLIVDDNAPFLRVACAFLEREGIEIVGVASNSAEALQLVEELRPQVTLVDINLGRESGFDLARRLAANGQRTSTAVILISTHAERDYAGLVEASPAAGFLAKSELSAEGIYAVLSRNGNKG